MAKQKLFKFNIKNVKFAVRNELGTYETPQDLAYANSLALESTITEKELFGDGQVLAVVYSDKGFSGTLSVTNLEDAYEKACGRLFDVDGGVADIKQTKSVPHAIYYEVDAIADGERITIKSWLFNCTTGRASESYQQNQDDITVNYYDYPLKVLGEVLKDSTGTYEYIDDKGNRIYVTRLTAYPDSPGYETFGDAVPELKATES